LTTRCSTGIYLSLLNQHLLTAVENSGDAFLSSALIGGKFVLRAWIVNFHTSLGDIEAVPLLLSRLGEEADTTLRAGARNSRGRLEANGARHWPVTMS